MLINLFDTNALIMNGNNEYVNNGWPVEGLKYCKPLLLEFDGISVFTDEMCFHPIVDKVKSKYKVAWAFESPVIKSHVYDHIFKIEDKFDYIYISNPKLHRNEKYKQCYYGACWIPKEQCKIYDKVKLLSIVASNKNFAPGHKLRHEVIKQKLHPELELWGSGYRWYKDTERVKPFADYMYNIVIENCVYPGYFTEKLIDCFATGSIPIYYGFPEVRDLFNGDGLYTFNTIEELKSILAKISIEDYRSKAEAILDNYNRFWEYASPDEWMLKNCYNKLEEN